MAQTIDKIIVHADDPGLMYWFVDGARMGPLRRDYAEKLDIHVGATWNKAKARKVDHLNAEELFLFKAQVFATGSVKGGNEVLSFDNSGALDLFSGDSK